MPTQNEPDILASLRYAIDHNQLDDIKKIFSTYPEIDWNAISPNGLSALWWALTPPAGQPINISVIDLLASLKRDGQFVIDPAQSYAGLRPDDYLSDYERQLSGQQLHGTKLIGYINKWQDLYFEANQSQNTANTLVGLTLDTHNASNPLVMNASDASLKRLYTRYQSDFNEETELAEIETFIHSPKFKELFPLIHEQQDQIRSALDWIKNDKTIRVTLKPNEGPRLLKTALALTWRAVKEKDKQILAEGATEDPSDRQKAIFTGILEAQSAYGANRRSCWQGTWGRIGTALCGMHQEVYYKQNEPLTGQLARDKGIALIGNELDALYIQHRGTYWSVLRCVLGTAEDKNDQSLYDEWRQGSMLERVQQGLRNTPIKEENVQQLVKEWRDSIPLSQHELSRKFVILQRYFYKIKRSDIFDNFLTKLNKNTDINKAIEELKAIYLEKMHVPAELKELKQSEVNEIKEFVLETLLDRRYAEENILEEDVWRVAFVQSQLKKQFSDSYLLQWYRDLEWDKKLLLANEKIPSTGVMAFIVEFAIKNTCVAGLSFVNQDLSGVDFRGVDLRGIDFGGANLTKADLRLATAEEAKWNGCNLAKAKFNQWLLPEALIGSIQCSSELLALQNDNGDTILGLAIENDRLDIVKAILASTHFKPELLLKQKESVLIMAMHHGKPEIIKAILGTPHGTSDMLMAAKDSLGSPILFYAMQQMKNLEIFRAILASPYCSREVVAEKYSYFTDPKSILHTAIREIELLNSSMIVHPHINRQKEHAFFIEISKTILSFPYCFSLLVQQDNDSRDTILHHIVKMSHLDILKIILESPYCTPALFSIKNALGQTVFDVAKDGLGIDQGIVETKKQKVIKQLELKNNQFKKEFIIDLERRKDDKDFTRSDILDLFKKLKDSQGEYSYIHYQRNPKWDKLRLFFKGLPKQNKEEKFWHTATYQKAVKILKEAYLARNDALDPSRKNEADEFIDYKRGNAPLHTNKTSTRRLIKK